VGSQDYVAFAAKYDIVLGCDNILIV
jgi:hypothetical protein